MNETSRSPSRRARAMSLGYLAALAAVLITGAYPAVTRASVTATLTPGDLLLFRFGVSGLMFAPFLFVRRRSLARADWVSALPLSVLQGWGMAACVVVGLKLAPASHAAALGPGVIAAWIALFGYVAYGIRVRAGRLAGIAIIVAGALMILAASGRGPSGADELAGDAMFLAASALGANYFVYMQRRNLDPILGAALVCVTSAVVVVPWHVLFATSTIALAPFGEVLWQIAVQGIIVGCLALLALNCAALSIGSQSLGVLSALVPVIGALFSLAITGDPISPPEWAAILVISFGVIVASLPVAPARPSLARFDGVVAMGRSTTN